MYVSAAWERIGYLGDCCRSLVVGVSLGTRKHIGVGEGGKCGEPSPKGVGCTKSYCCCVMMKLHVLMYLAVGAMIELAERDCAYKKMIAKMAMRQKKR